MKDQILNQIDKALDWYNKNYKGYQDIEMLLNLSDKLALLNCNLVEILAESSKSYLSLYLDRKIMFAGFKLNYHSDGNSLAKSEELATKGIKDIKQREIEAEVELLFLKEKRRAIEKVLQSVQQRISYLKQEKQRMNISNNQENKRQ